MRKLMIPTLAVAALAGLAAPASAGEVTIRINTQGLDLSDEAAFETMKSRIATAVNDACATPAIARTYGSQAVAECKADGLAKATADLESRRSAALAIALPLAD